MRIEDDNDLDDESWEQKKESHFPSAVSGPLYTGRVFSRQDKIENGQEKKSNGPGGKKPDRMTTQFVLCPLGLTEPDSREEELTRDVKFSCFPGRPKTE